MPIPPGMQGKLAAWLEAKGAEAEQLISRNIVVSERVDTGLMRDSTYHESIGPLQQRVGVKDLDYTKYQEFGTRPRAGNRGIEGAHFVGNAKLEIEHGGKT